MLAWILRGIGQQSPQWINDPQLSLVMVIIVYVWKNLGYCAVVYLAGLQSLPQDVMEAASLDGASGFRRFVSMSLPLLSPTTFFLLITTMLSSLQAFDLIRIMTPAGQRHQHPDLRGLPPGLRRLQPGRLLRGHLGDPVRHPAGHHGAAAAVRRKEGALLVSAPARRLTLPPDARFNARRRPDPATPAVLPRQPGPDSRCRVCCRWSSPSWWCSCRCCGWC